MNPNLRFPSIKLSPNQVLQCTNDPNVQQGPRDLHRSLAAWRWITANVGHCPPGAAMQQFENVIVAQINLPVCSFCGGRGHEPKECMSRIVLDRKASELGMRFWWG